MPYTYLLQDYTMLLDLYTLPSTAGINDPFPTYGQYDEPISLLPLSEKSDHSFRGCLTAINTQAKATSPERSNDKFVRNVHLPALYADVDVFGKTYLGNANKIHVFQRDVLRPRFPLYRWKRQTCDEECVTDLHIGTPRLSDGQFAVPVFRMGWVDQLPTWHAALKRKTHYMRIFVWRTPIDSDVAVRDTVHYGVRPLASRSRLHFSVDVSGKRSEGDNFLEIQRNHWGGGYAAKPMNIYLHKHGFKEATLEHLLDANYIFQFCFSETKDGLSPPQTQLDSSLYTMSVHTNRFRFKLNNPSAVVQSQFEYNFEHNSGSTAALSSSEKDNNMEGAVDCIVTSSTPSVSPSVESALLPSFCPMVSLESGLKSVNIFFDGSNRGNVADARQRSQCPYIAGLKCGTCAPHREDKEEPTTEFQPPCCQMLS